MKYQGDRIQILINLLFTLFVFDVGAVDDSLHIHVEYNTSQYHTHKRKKRMAVDDGGGRTTTNATCCRIVTPHNGAIPSFLKLISHRPIQSWQKKGAYHCSHAHAFFTHHFHSYQNTISNKLRSNYVVNESYGYTIPCIQFRYYKLYQWLYKIV